MHTLWQDVRYGLRGIWNRPGFAFLGMLTLGLGMGAATTIFSAIRSFTDPPGLRYSTLARTVAPMPSVTEFSLTRGVSPTRSAMCSAYFTPVILSRHGRGGGGREVGGRGGAPSGWMAG